MPFLNSQINAALIGFASALALATIPHWFTLWQAQRARAEARRIAAQANLEKIVCAYRDLAAWIQVLHKNLDADFPSHTFHIIMIAEIYFPKLAAPAREVENAIAELREDKENPKVENFQKMIFALAELDAAIVSEADKLHV